jgi:hypothetical protein
MADVGLNSGELAVLVEVLAGRAFEFLHVVNGAGKADELPDSRRKRRI